MTPSVALFNKLGWIPFYEQHKLDKCIIMYKRINGYLPNYLNEHLILNNKRHSRNTRYSSIKNLMPFVLNVVKKQSVGALSLFRQHNCGIVYQLKLGN